MGKNPAFLFYPSDWANDLSEHPLEIEGAWIRLCCKLWWSDPKGELTRPLENWSRVLGISVPETQRIFDYFSTYSICDICVTRNGDVTVRSRRMFRDDRDRRQAAERQRRRREKRGSNADVTVASSVSVSVTDTNTKKNTKKKSSADASVFDTSFAVFYTAYPRKSAKPAALKAWRKIAPQNGLVEEIMAALKKHIEFWRDKEKTFIPHPATWLNQRRWEDVMEDPTDRRWEE